MGEANRALVDWELVGRLRHRGTELFGRDPGAAFFAPGRVNMLGAHLDYSGGDVLPTSVHLGVYAVAMRRTDLRLRVASLDLEPELVEVDGSAVDDAVVPDHRWAGYVIGVWREFAKRTGIRSGLDVCCAGNLPIGAGLSSSAAIGVCTAAALDRLHGTELPLEQLAEVAHAAENEFVGVPCGIMDQYASALAGDGAALLLHCFDRTFEPIPLDREALTILIVDTRKSRQLAVEEGFAARVRETREALSILSGLGEDRGRLAAYSPAEVDAGREQLGETLFKRARHVSTEMERLHRGVERLRAGDLVGFGRQVTASHRSTQFDYEVSCDELDAVVDAATGCPGVYGSRLTGAGFGGCAVVLLHPSVKVQVQDVVRAVFTERFSVEPGFIELRPGPSPGVVMDR